MKIAKRFRANCSGQLLIVAALTIAILIASTSIYVYELTVENHNMENSLAVELFLAVKTGLRNAVISALANITNGGQKTVLAEDLDTLTEAYMRVHPQQICQIAYTLLNGVRYVDGLRLSWGNADGLGVSSAYVFYTLKALGPASNIIINDAINITTLLTVNGHYATNEDDVKIVNLTCRIFNENKPAQAKRIVIYYEDAFGIWVPVDTLSIMDWGNGTYTMSFTVTITVDMVHVSVRVVDTRNIFVAANTTCSQAG